MLNEDYKEMLQRLLDAGVEFLLVGAYALAAHGHPRATGDIDIWVRPSSGNARRVYIALAAFGAPLQDVTPQDFSHPDVVFQIGVAPRRIDIMTGISGLEFAGSCAKRFTGGNRSINNSGLISRGFDYKQRSQRKRKRLVRRADSPST